MCTRCTFVLIFSTSFFFLKIPPRISTADPPPLVLTERIFHIPFARIYLFQRTFLFRWTYLFRLSTLTWLVVQMIAVKEQEGILWYPAMERTFARVQVYYFWRSNYSAIAKSPLPPSRYIWYKHLRGGTFNTNSISVSGQYKILVTNVNIPEMIKTDCW